jgi:hypothetical protein
VVQEDTEQRMHSVADSLPDPEHMHELADQLSEQADQHRRNAQQLRDRSADDV